MTTLSDLRSLWISAWIDDRDVLLESYAQILKLPDPQRRAAGIALLVDLPLTMGDVLAFKEEREEKEAAHGEIDQWKAQKEN